MSLNLHIELRGFATSKVLSLFEDKDFYNTFKKDNPHDFKLITEICINAFTTAVSSVLGKSEKSNLFASIDETGNDSITEIQYLFKRQIEILTGLENGKELYNQVLEENKYEKFSLNLFLKLEKHVKEHLDRNLILFFNRILPKSNTEFISTLNNESATNTEKAEEIRDWMEQNKTAFARYQHTTTDLSQLTLIPPEIKYLTNLRDIYFNGNYTKYIPREMLSFTKLGGRVNFNANQLESLPIGIKYLKNFKGILDLTHNNLTSYSGLESLTKLRALNLSHVNLPLVPDEVLLLPKLRVLFMDYCCLITLPKGLTDLKKLKYIGLQDHKISTLPVELCSYLYDMVEDRDFYENLQRIKFS
jgi:hypothetical protein